ncbi:MAG: YARHG domain-containing protein [Gammaproteobacteria bacterium]|nr:YARHG domain-containing protein [Gammaproteobacteria bacterium]
MVYNQRFLQAEKDNVNLIKNYEQGNLPRTRHEFSSSRQKKTLASKYLETSTKRLTAADLRGKSKKTLRLMRNEIYARRGFCFKPGGELRQYFDRQPWYRCNIGNSQQVYNRRFSQTEKDNVNLIKRYE